MHPDMIKTIQAIDEKIKELKQAKQILLKTFGPGYDDKKSFTKTAGKEPSKRKKTVIDLIKTEGPLKRSQIIIKTGLPAGTVSYILNDKTLFFGENGKWHLVDENKKDDINKTRMIRFSQQKKTNEMTEQQSDD